MRNEARRLALTASVLSLAGADGREQPWSKSGLDGHVHYWTSRFESYAVWGGWLAVAIVILSYKFVPPLLNWFSEWRQLAREDKRKVLKAEAEARDTRLKQQQIMNEKAAVAMAAQREQEQLRRRLDAEKKSASIEGRSSRSAADLPKFINDPRFPGMGAALGRPGDPTVVREPKSSAKAEAKAAPTVARRTALPAARGAAGEEASCSTGA